MTGPILAGIETEYGLFVEGHGAEDQVDDAVAFVRSYPGLCHVGWDYRYESPRLDLRGFTLNRLAIDPNDARFDSAPKRAAPHEIRSDRVLPNGARFYNDHGHPEYATPECLSLQGLARHDLAGEIVLRRTAKVYSQETGLGVRLYKNNTDFHGASYGTHESYLVPRSQAFEGLFRAVAPILVARTVLCGAGKVGSEHGKPCRFQLSQRADFVSEEANAETLYRRPLFNTRDEPHADSANWMRLHVIAGDANRISEATARKVGLVKLAISLACAGNAPVWRMKDPVEAFKEVSRDESYQFPIQLQGRSWTIASEILESYFAAAEATLGLDADMRWVINSSRELLAMLASDFTTFARHVDWAAKKLMLESYMAEQGTDWGDPALQSFDLEYHNLEPEESLFAALVDVGKVDACESDESLGSLLEKHDEQTRAYARGLSVSKFGEKILSLCWRTICLESDQGPVEIDLSPNVEFPLELEGTTDVGSFIRCLRGL